MWVLSRELDSCHLFGAAILELFLDFWEIYAPSSHVVKHVEEIYSGSRTLVRIQMKPATVPKRTVQTSSNKCRGVKNDTVFVFGTVAGPIVGWKTGYSKVFSYVGCCSRMLR